MAVTLNPSFIQSVGTPTGKAPKQKAPYLLARVVHTVVGPYYPGTKTPDPYYQRPTDIGKVTYQLLQGAQNRTSQAAGNPPAKPINSALKQLPVEGELVVLIPGPSEKLNETKGQQDYYYLTVFNIWNASHHNAFPDLGDVSGYANSQQRSYVDTSILNQPNNYELAQFQNYTLNPEFDEKDNIKSLRTFIGDVTLEGRWGNSIRLGSTTANREENNWSTTGSVGTPITIIRNGQGRQLDPTAWVPTVEDINRDPSSIYLTAGQAIVIDDIQNNFSLASLQVALERNISVAIPIQQQLTSYDSLSPLDQDKRVST